MSSGFRPAGELSLPLSQPLPVDYDFSTVLIKDSLTAHSNKTDFFAVRKINGMIFPNSFAKTLASKQNGATDMRPFLIDREVPARIMTLELMARTLYTPSLLNFTSKANRVSGEITFTPEANKSYVVKGVVVEDYAAVWLEEEGSGKMVSEKLEHHGPATLGILQKLEGMNREHHIFSQPLTAPLLTKARRPVRLRTRSVSSARLSDLGNHCGLPGHTGR